MHWHHKMDSFVLHFSQAVAMMISWLQAMGCEQMHCTVVVYAASSILID
jgi:hypothetical protein